MRVVSSEEHDIFQPRGQLAREVQLAKTSPAEVVAILGPRLSDERRTRIDGVVSHRTDKLTVAIEGVNDPHNTAAVIRSADAFGVQTVHVLERGTRFRSSRKVTQGAHKWVDLGVWQNPADFCAAMREQGKKVLIAAADGEKDLRSMGRKGGLALVFGNEHEGVSDEMRRQADGAFRIPMWGFVESLNISAAAAIVLSTLRRDGLGQLSPEEQEILRARFYLRAVRAGFEIVQREMKK